MSDYIISLKKAYKKYDGRTILNGINLNIREGEFVTVVGPTGCGKSTTLRLILGSETPTTGTVSMYDQEITVPNRDRGVVFQKYSLFPHKTVRENVMFGLELERFNLFDPITHTRQWIQKRKEFQKEADQYLERVRLIEHANKYPNQLSGGQRQRTAIAQAMIMKPKILMMDEPFGALDEGTREEMQVFTLEQWKQTKQTVLFVTHSLEEAIFMGTRLLVISQYYDHEDGSEGAKIVKDVEIPWPHPRSTKIKNTNEFNNLMEAIRYEGLNPNHLQNIGNFDLSHRDSIKDVN
ncbi:MAG: ABC transporter ATP-binding protein [Salinivirgaceae bacterium]|jgi:NitT/TauT family transport system ATP-binding protein